MLDMDRLQHDARSLRREKSPHRPHGGCGVASPDFRVRGVVGDDFPLSPKGAKRGGNVQMRRHTSSLKLDPDHKVKIPTGSRTENSSMKASGESVKILMEQEVQNHIESRRHSSGIIARLMGLDPLPAQQPHSRQNKSVKCFDRRPFEDLVEKHVSSGERKQEFKDIFEVLETREVEVNDWHGPKRLLSSRRNMVRSEDSLHLVTRHFPTRNRLQNPDKFAKVSKGLDSSKNYSAKFLEEPSPLFERYLRDLHSFPAIPEGSDIMILKSTNGAKHEKNEICLKSKKRSEKSHTRQGNSYKCEPEALVSSNKKQAVSYSTRSSSRSKFVGKADASSVPTRIVVLKPSIEKSQTSSTKQNTSETHQFGNLDYRMNVDVESGNLVLLSDLREKQDLCDDGELLFRINGSKKIAKEVTKHMRDSVIDGFGTGLEAMGRISSLSNGWSIGHSAPYVMETRTSKEGRNHLSERWMTTHKFQEVGLSSDRLSTLGEMLALSDWETPGTHSSSVSCQERSHSRFHMNHKSKKYFSPSGISSKDGWKNKCPSGLSRSKSLPSTCSFHVNSSNVQGTSCIENPSMLKDILNFGSVQFSAVKSVDQQHVFPYGAEVTAGSSSQHSGTEEENKLHVKEIHADLDINSQSEEPLSSLTSACSISDIIDLAGHTPSAVQGSAECSNITGDNEQVQSFSSIAPSADDFFLTNNDEEIVPKEILDNQPEDNSWISCAHVAKRACSLNGEEIEQPSPNSVLEPPDENEYIPTSFERVSAELQGLRMQLELLRSESRETVTDRDVASYEDACEEVIDVLVAGARPTTDEEGQRDSSYVLSVLRNSGFNNDDLDSLFSAFYSPESPLCPDVFEKLENGYDGEIWTRSERKLLFDAVNSILAGNLVLKMNQHPWAKPRRTGFIGCRKSLPDEVCQEVLKQLKASNRDASSELMDDIRWLDLADDVGSIGREVEKLLKDYLIEELVTDIACMHDLEQIVQHIPTKNPTGRR